MAADGSSSPSPPFNNGINWEQKKSLFSPTKLTASSPTAAAALMSSTRRSMGVAYAFMVILGACTFLFFCNDPSSDSRSPVWLRSIINTRSQFSTHFSHYIIPDGTVSTQYSRKANGFFIKKREDDHSHALPVKYSGSKEVGGDLNKTSSPESAEQHHRSNNGTSSGVKKQLENEVQDSSSASTKESSSSSPSSSSPEGRLTETREQNTKSKHENTDNGGLGDAAAAEAVQQEENWWEQMRDCDIFDGEWVKDDSYPLYEPGSCPHIDEPFNCHVNGRPDKGHQNFRWQPKHCNIPRLNGKHVLEFLRGKRMVYVGDSLNRNMWESMICLLQNSVENKSKVYEVSGRSEFRKEGAYSFIFEEYNCSVEFYRSPFLVQEWEAAVKNGSKKETLRLDLVERSCDEYKNADVLVFNTGHWWTHEKTAAGEEYYQEGSHVYGKLDVIEAFRKALTTWAGWIEGNVDPRKTQVFFRGYSMSHFSGGEWYSGGKCHTDTEPVADEKGLSPPGQHLPMIGMLENVLNGMKAPVSYLNITRMTDFRKDAHPSVYRMPNMTHQQKQLQLRHQDCTHWCLPGVPDTWNELMFAQLLAKHLDHRKPLH